MTFEDQLVRLLALLADALDSAPGDTALMLRRADTLLRAMQAEERLLGGDKTRLSKNLEVILSRFGDLIVPPDR